MTLRDRMVYAGIRTSRRFARLSWFERDLFQGILHVADDYGRFEVDVGMLRTVLYGPSLHKVSERDLQGALLRFGEVGIGLVKFYAVAGRGYGKVLNFRQTGLTKRRGWYPDEEGVVPEPELVFTASEGKKEGESPQPPAAAGGRNPSEFSEAAELPAVRQRRPSRRLPKLADLHEELDAISEEMRGIMRPGGCAYNVAPTGEKAARLDKLFAQRNALEDTINRVRDELSQRNKEELARV